MGCAGLQPQQGVRLSKGAAGHNLPLICRIIRYSREKKSSPSTHATAPADTFPGDLPPTIDGRRVQNVHILHTRWGESTHFVRSTFGFPTYL